MKYILILIISINIFANDFRGNSWGISAKEVLQNEGVKTFYLKENPKSTTYKTFKGDYQYNYIVTDYSFSDNIESLGVFSVTMSFLKDKLFKATYTKEFKELKQNKEEILEKTKKKVIGPKVFVDPDNSFEKMKQYLIWKYGENYKTYGISDTFEWETGRTKVVLSYYSNRNYTVEYYANTELMKEFIESAENGKEYYDELGTEFGEFNKIKDKI